MLFEIDLSTDLRDIYELLLKNDGLPGSRYHQMERKGGRSPTLRLRFGKRADSSWNKEQINDGVESSN